MREPNDALERVPGVIRLAARWVVLTLLLLSGSSLPAQHFGFSLYDASSGLTNLNVSNLLEDHTGALWVGTESGVFLGDGLRFHKQMAFTDAGFEFIHILREDGAGRIWAISSQHLGYWDGTHVRLVPGMKLKTVAGDAVDLVPDPTHPDALYLLYEGTLIRIASADHGLTWTLAPALPPGLVTQHPELAALSSLVSDGASALWAGCGTKLCRLEMPGGTLSTFGPAEGVAPQIWKTLLLTREGVLWARGEKNLVSHHPQEASFTAVPYPSAAPTPNGQTPRLAQDANGDLLLNLVQGMARLKDGAWSVFSSKDGLAEEEIQTLMVGHTGSLWIAPQGHGLLRWQGYGAWEGWTRAEGLRSNVVWMPARASGGPLWTITEEGLNQLDPATGHVAPPNAALPQQRLRVGVVDRRQHVWTGDALGQIREFDPQTGHTRSAGPPLGRIFHLLLDARERLWICSRDGLRVFTPDDQWKEPRQIDDPAAPQGYAWSITEGNDGTLWVSTGQGLFRLRGAVWSKIDLPFPGGTGYNFLLAAAPDGTLWVQSKLPYPVLRLRVTGSSAVIVDRVPGATFGSDNITFMHTDPRGWLWVGSDDGVHVFDGNRWVQCTSEDGLLWEDTDFQGFLADADGSVWIGTSGGLSHVIRPESLFRTPAPSLRLMEARLGNIKVREGQPGFDLRRPTLTVRLLDTSYGRGRAIVYRYRLEGQESDWLEGNESSLRFPALNPGGYTLTAVAYDQRTHESSPPVSLSFTLLAPWWQRGWFHLVEWLLALLLGFCLWRFSVHLLVSRQQVLERLIASRTGELEREKTELISARSALLETTRRDALTGLLNRATIFATMNSLCEASHRTGRPLAVAMADLDSFKNINDHYGHVTGDAVLRECARRIELAMRPDDAVGRYGGEELLILMPGLHCESAPLRMEQLRAAIAATPITHGELSLTVTCSFGVAWTGIERCSLESLVALADDALYRAKRNGRNRVEFAIAGTAQADDPTAASASLSPTPTAITRSAPPSPLQHFGR